MGSWLAVSLRGSDEVKWLGADQSQVPEPTIKALKNQEEGTEPSTTRDEKNKEQVSAGQWSRAGPRRPDA